MIRMDDFILLKHLKGYKCLKGFVVPVRFIFYHVNPYKQSLDKGWPNT